MDDIVDDDLDALIVAINPSTRSETMGHAFASPGNPFWRLLHTARLTPVELAPHEERRLLEFRLGLVSTVARATPSIATLGSAELRAGAEHVRDVVRARRPSVVALLGLSLAPLFPEAATERGPGPRRSALEGARLFVLPNPSGRNRAYPGFDAKLVWYRALAVHLGRT